jgi:hypothetical protein
VPQAKLLFPAMQPMIRSVHVRSYKLTCMHTSASVFFFTFSVRVAAVGVIEVKGPGSSLELTSSTLKGFSDRYKVNACCVQSPQIPGWQRRRRSTQNVSACRVCLTS